MRIFLTGATGFIGSEITRELLANGHKVLGLARSDAGAEALTAAGVDVQRGDLEDLDSLRSGAAAADGVIHTAFVHDFSRYMEAGEIEQRAVTALGDALAGSGKPLVITSGTAAVRSGVRATEEMAGDPASAGAARVAAETIVLELAQRGVRSAVMRLPPTVHDAGDHGFVPALIAIARQKGMSAYLGDGANRWPAVNRKDAARLFRLAAERAPAGTVLHAVAEEGLAFKDIAGAIASGLGVPVASVPVADAAAQFGWLGKFVCVDNPTSSAATRQRFGWQPTGPTLLEDLAQTDYFAG